MAVAFCFLFVFVCFFPNPAVPIGANTGWQAGQILAFLFVPAVLVLGLPKRQALALMLILLPILVSGFAIVMTRRALSDELAVNSIVATLLSLIVIIPVGWAASERYLIPLLTGVGCAIVTHALLGAYQVYSFSRNVFPLLGLYQNPSYRNFIQSNAEEWAVYVKRPFGLFPEPSAMAASIGPWLVLIFGLLLYPKLRARMGHRTKWFMVFSAVSGVALVFASRSGYVIILMASLLLMSAPKLKEYVLRVHRPAGMAVSLLLAISLVAAVFLAVTLLGSRLDIQQNYSWIARASSIVYGLTYLTTDAGSLLFGAGPGQSYLILQSSDISGILPSSAGEEAVEAVFSVSVLYIQEAGLLGMAALTLVLALVLRAIARSSARLLGLCTLMAWLGGVILTTSYINLSPVWLMLGVLLGWDHLFRRRPAMPSGRLGSVSETAYPRRAVRT